MDFANRGNRPAQPTVTSPTGAPVSQSNEKAKKEKSAKATRIVQVLMLVAVGLIALALIFMLVFGYKSNDEAQYVDKEQYQAVFLNGGQVYFGKIGDYTTKYLTLNDIYYLRVNQQVQPGQTSAQTDVSLAKLGNELHGPEDQMIINKSEVQFWENLKEEGQVVCAIRDYQINTLKINGVKKSDKCPAPTTNQSSSNNTQQETTNTTNTNTTNTTNTNTRR